MQSLWANAAAAFSIGLLGSAHCVAMCSGLATAHPFTARPFTAQGGTSAPVRFDLGAAVTRAALLNGARILQYATLAALTASLGSIVLSPMLANSLRAVGAAVMILMGLRFAGFGAPKRARCVHSSPRSTRGSLRARSTLLAGLLWGSMPCSLVYSTLMWAVTTGGALAAATVMLAFGCGTLPAMIITGVAARGLRVSIQRARPLAGAILVFFGVITLHSALQTHAHVH